MGTIEFIFTRARNDLKLFSAVTRWRLKRPYSHVAIVFHSQWLGMPLVIQASHGMVHVVPLDHMKRDNKVVATYKIYMTQEEIGRGVRWAISMCGRGYSELGALACTVPLLRKLKLASDGDKEFICSEFAARFLEEAKGIQLDHMRDDDHVDPAMIEDLIIWLSQENA